jgi:hypothetical protein
MINFNEPCITGNEEKYILQSMKNHKISGDVVSRAFLH